MMILCVLRKWVPISMCVQEEKRTKTQQEEIVLWIHRPKGPCRIGSKGGGDWARDEEDLRV